MIFYKKSMQKSLKDKFAKFERNVEKIYNFVV